MQFQNFLRRIRSFFKTRKNRETIPDWSEVYEDVIPKMTVFNQRNIPACVAHTTATMMQIEWYRRTGKIINFSPRFLDILSWTDNLSINDGRDPDVVMSLATTVGCCTEDLLPNDTTLPIEKYRDKTILTKEMFSEATKYRLANLGLVPKTLFDARNDHQPSRIQQAYNTEINDARIAGHKRLNEIETQLLVTFKKSQISEDIERNLKEVPELGIELVDSEKIEKLQGNVDQKYKGENIGGIGGGPISDFIVSGLIILTFWSLRHILDDFDNALWERLKKAFVGIFKSSKKVESNDKNITIQFTNPQIIFEFPVEMSEELFARELETVRALAEEIHKKTDRMDFSYKYTYGTQTNEWLLETNRSRGF